MAATIVADDREREIIPLLSAVETATVDVVVRRLCVGDYAVTVQNRIAIVIERKTLQDLAASMRDGRMESQCAKLRELLATEEAAQRQPPRVLFLIEGSSSSSSGGIPFASLQAKVDTLMLRDHFGVIWTRDAAHTAKRLVALAQTSIGCLGGGGGAVAQGGGDTPPAVVVVVDEVVGALQQAKPTDEAAVRIEMLCELKGVSKTTAKALLREHRITDVLLGRVDETTLAATRYHQHESSSTLGVARAAHIARQGRELSGVNPSRDGTPQRSVASRILMKLRGVSRAVAGGMLGAFSFEDLLSSSYDAATLAKCPRAGSKRCIGPAIVNTLRQTVY